MRSSNLVDMTPEQLYTLKSNYCQMIIDGMDMDCLIQMCYDLLMDSYTDCDETALKEEILDLYDSETLEDLLVTETI